MKKTISLLLALLAVLSLAACQNADPEGTSITTEATTEAATVPAPQLQAGYYLLTSYETDGLTIEGEMADEMKMYIRIEEDGTGLFSITGMSVELTWDDSFLSVEDAPCAYTLEDDLLILTVDDSTKFALQYHGDELPEYYVSPTVQPGYYVASSVGDNGNVTFYSTIDPENGWVRLGEDLTGTLYYDGIEYEVFCDASNFYAGGKCDPLLLHRILRWGAWTQ